MRLDWRGDLAFVPRLVRSPAILIPGAIALIVTALFLAIQPLGSQEVVDRLFQLFVLPPSLVAIVIAAVLARRARYLAGAIASLIGALAFGFAVLVTPISLSDGGDSSRVEAIGQALVLSPLFGLAIGAFFDAVAWVAFRLFRADRGESLVRISELGDLRDRGLITPAEFEAKKADLLRRV